MSPTIQHQDAVVIGAGPAGLMVAEQLSQAGITVDIYDAMPTVGRKFLRAGIGGLNLTHNEPFTDFVARYGDQSPLIEQWLAEFGAQDLRAWAGALGIDTFVGSSGRVFPLQKKAAPLLRAWLKRLKQNGVGIHPRHRWCGWDGDDRLSILSPEGKLLIRARTTVFALGGASWSRLGSNGTWKALFEQQGISCPDFRPSNCGFNATWNANFSEAFSGTALKGVVLALPTANGEWRKQGDALICDYGLEGGLLYAASALIRDQIESTGACTVYWDLIPEKSEAQLQQAISQRRAKDSVANVLRKQLGLRGAKLGLLKQLTDKARMQDLDGLPALVKRLPQQLLSARPLDEAISTAGGIGFSELSPQLMLTKMPGNYCIGEMLDWEAPTGGYLLTACFASAAVASRAIINAR